MYLVLNFQSIFCVTNVLKFYYYFKLLIQNIYCKLLVRDLLIMRKGSQNEKKSKYLFEPQKYMQKM